MTDGVDTCRFSNAEASLLFPERPQASETLLGFIQRSAIANDLPSTKPILERAEITSPDGTSLFTHGVDNPALLASALGVSADDLSTLWGYHPLYDGRRRLGGVLVRAKFICSTHRIVPASYLPTAPDKAIWLIDGLGFELGTWEYLIKACAICGRPFRWHNAIGVDRCACGSLLRPRRAKKVAQADRGELAWLSKLFSDDPCIVETAMRSVPASSTVQTATDAYEVIMALAKPMAALRTPQPRKPLLSDIAQTTRYLLEFPRSYWDVNQRGDTVGIALKENLRDVARHSTQVVVSTELSRMAHYMAGGRITIAPRFYNEEPIQSLALAASNLKASKGGVRRLVEAGILTGLGPQKGKERYHHLYRGHEVAQVKRQLGTRLSWKKLKSTERLPDEAIEQLIGSGYLRENSHEAVRVLYGDRQLDDPSYLAFKCHLKRHVSDDSSTQYIPLNIAMCGVGGRPKPWAKIFEVAISGALAGGLVQDDWRTPLGQLRIHKMTARLLVMGGPDHDGPYRAHPMAPDNHVPLMQSGEVERYLNCTAQDISWLRAKWLLHAQTLPHELARYLRTDVAQCGLEVITTREIAARRGLTPLAMQATLQQFDQTIAIGQGFYRRPVIEEWLVSLKYDDL